LEAALDEGVFNDELNWWVVFNDQDKRLIFQQSNSDTFRRHQRDAEVGGWFRLTDKNRVGENWCCQTGLNCRNRAISH
jgi:hypothetical protein